MQSHFPPASTTPSLHSLLVPFHTPPPHNHLCFDYKQPVSCTLLGFDSAAAKERVTLHIHSKYSIHTHKHPIPTPFVKVYKRTLYPTPLLTKTVRHWGVHKHHTGWRLVDVPLKVGLDISRTNADSQWNTTYFIEFFDLETKPFVGSFVHVILTRQTCGHRSSRVAEIKRRALGNYFSKRICYIFLI